MQSTSITGVCLALTPLLENPHRRHTELRSFPWAFSTKGPLLGRPGTIFKWNVGLVNAPESAPPAQFISVLEVISLNCEGFFFFIFQMVPTPVSITKRRVLVAVRTVSPSLGLSIPAASHSPALSRSMPGLSVQPWNGTACGLFSFCVGETQTWRINAKQVFLSLVCLLPSQNKLEC